MSSESDFIASLAAVQLYLYRFGAAILIGIGSIGCILNMIVFSKKNLRENPCSIYFIALNLANLLQICFSLLQAMLVYAYNINIATSSSSLCHFSYYIGYVFDIISPFYLILSSIDRLLITSPNAQTRRRSTRRLAYICIIGGTIFWMLVLSHVLIFSQVIEIIPNYYYICYFNSDLYLSIMSYYTLSKTLIVPLLMFICELWSIKNIKNIRRARVTPGSMRLNNVLNRRHSIDRQLIRILSINITIYIVFNLMTVAVDVYQQITRYRTKNLMQSQTEALVMNLSYFSYYIPFSVGCYVNLIVSKTFRNEVKNILLCK